MIEYTGPVAVLDAEECFEKLATQNFGRMVLRVGEVIEVFPFNFVVDGRSLVMRTAAGTKLAAITISDEVLVEVDERTETSAWSVVLRGKATVLERSAEIEAAEELPLRPQIPTMKRTFVRITPTSVSGRSFDFSAEPDRSGPQDY